MAAKVRQKQVFEGGIVLDNHELTVGANPTVETGVTISEQKAPQLKRLTLALEDFEVAIDADDDYGSALVATFPNRNVLVAAAIADLDVVVAGGIATAAAIDAALGTVALTSTDFSNAGEDDLTLEADGVGATASGTLDLVPTEVPNFIAAAADNEIHLNVQATIETDGTATFTGTIDVYYYDLDA